MHLDETDDRSVLPCALLRPQLLIAATINKAGHIDLCVVEDGGAVPGAGIEFCLDENGEIFQRRYWTFGPSEAEVRRAPAEPLSMVTLAVGLNHTFGTRTPVLFRLTYRPGSARPTLSYPGKGSDQARIKILHDAFAIQMIAYEERLI